MSKYILTLCCLLILMDAARAGATTKVEIHIPAKPDSFLCDHVHLWSWSPYHTQGIKKMAMDVHKRRHVSPYILTIDSTYLPYIDTFIYMVCNSWQICGDDSTALLVVCNDPDHRLFIAAGARLQKTLNDTMMAYLTGEYLQPVSYTPNDGESALKWLGFFDGKMDDKISQLQYSIYADHNDSNKENKTFLIIALIILVIVVWTLIWNYKQKGIRLPSPRSSSSENISGNNPRKPNSLLDDEN